MSQSSWLQFSDGLKPKVYTQTSPYKEMDLPGFAESKSEFCIDVYTV